MSKLLASLMLMSFAAPALAQSTEAALAAQKGEPAKEKKVCRRDVATGSIMPRRICLTKAQWAEIGEQSQDSVDRFRHRPTSNSERPGGGL